MPGVIPVTTPVEEPTVAVDVLPLLHVPPGIELVSVIVAPAHTGPAPDMESELTVTIAVSVQLPAE